MTQSDAPNEIKSNIKDFTKCPHCGFDDGYYTKLYISGWTIDFKTFKGEPQNWNMFDPLKYSRETKYYYCYHCNKKICRR